MPAGLKSRIFYIFVVVSVVALTYLYLYPGSAAMLEGRRDLFLSDGTDPTTIPALYDVILQTWQKHPSHLFYGTVYAEAWDPDRGSSFWVPWNERWLVVGLSNFLVTEQIYAGFAFCLLVLNALAMFGFSAYMGHPRWISLGLAFSWAFCAYTRARAKVHGALAGIYHLPLIFLGLLMIVRGRDKRTLVGAALSLLLAGSVAHYYLVTSVFLSPLFLLFVVIQPEFKTEWKRISIRMALAVVPLLLFLGFNFAFPLPPDARMSAANTLEFGWTDPSQTDPYLYVFHAFPEDYLAGDISLTPNSAVDWNPVREWIGEGIIANQGYSNTHERTNGIRWSILILAMIAVILLALGKMSGEARTHRAAVYFCIFAIFGFWMAGSPNFPWTNAAPSYWIYSLFNKVRIPSRAGILVHFSLLVLVGGFLAMNLRGMRWLTLPGVFAGIVLLDYLPLQAMPMAPVYPVFQELQREKGECGVGMYFPFISPQFTPGYSYYFTQRMRGSDCYSLNAMGDVEKIRRLSNLFPPTPEFVKGLSSDSRAPEALARFARCASLNWIVFDQGVPGLWAADVCRQLGWSLHPDGSCVSRMKNRYDSARLQSCL